MHRADGAPRTKAQLVAHVDPHLSYVPSVLVQFVLKVFSPMGYRTMRKVLRSHGKDSCLFV